MKLYLSCLVFLAVTSGTLQTDHTVTPFENDVTLVTSPTEVKAGVTKHLEVNCTFADGNHTDFAAINSLILSKSTSGQDDILSEIATVTSVSPDSVEVKDDIGAQVKGQIVTNGESYISFTWSYPTSKVIGSYQCEAYGMSRTGHPIVSSAAAEIGERSVDFDLVFERIREMDVIQEHLAGELEQVRAQQNATQTELEATKAKLAALELRVNNSQKSMIEASRNYLRHDYYLSLEMEVSHKAAQSLCTLYGGYLAEINEEAEFSFIAKFLNDTQVKDYVMVGATDEDVEDTWVFLHSGAPMTYFNWLPGQPSKASGEDCMWLGPGAPYKMVDWHCDTDGLDWRFLCEIPH